MQFQRKIKIKIKFMNAQDKLEIHSITWTHNLLIEWKCPNKLRLNTYGTVNFRFCQNLQLNDRRMNDRTLKFHMSWEMHKTIDNLTLCLYFYSVNLRSLISILNHLISKPQFTWKRMKSWKRWNWFIKMLIGIIDLKWIWEKNEIDFAD